MKLTNEQLKRIIKEELESALKEYGPVPDQYRDDQDIHSQQYVDDKGIHSQQYIYDQDIHSQQFKDKLKKRAKTDFNVRLKDFVAYSPNILPRWAMQGYWQDIIKKEFPQIEGHFKLAQSLELNTGNVHHDNVQRYYKYLADAMGIEQR